MKVQVTIALEALVVCKLEEEAEKAGLSFANYVREKLGDKSVPLGRPPGHKSKKVNPNPVGRPKKICGIEVMREVQASGVDLGQAFLDSMEEQSNGKVKG